jgi:hypothetical protein
MKEKGGDIPSMPLPAVLRARTRVLRLSAQSL